MKNSLLCSWGKIQPASYGHPVNKDTLYGPLSIYPCSGLRRLSKSPSSDFVWRGTKDFSYLISANFTDPKTGRCPGEGRNTISPKNACGGGYIFGAKCKWKPIKRDKSTSFDFVARGRPLRGQTRLASLTKRSTCSKSMICAGFIVAGVL